MTKTERRSKEAELHRLLGPVAQRDAEVIEFWRHRSPAEHADAGIQLSNLATQMAVQTGFGKNPDEMFPGFPPLRD